MSVQIPERAYPLTWPIGWKRSTIFRESAFGNHSLAHALHEVQRNVKLIPARRMVVLTNVALRLDGLPYSNQPKVKDPGVAVYFVMKDRPIVLACDKWNRVECNLWAIAKHVEALRGQERWGIGTVEQAFTGYMALPAPMDLKPWWEVLGIKEEDGHLRVRQAYRDLAVKNHPDNGGSHEGMVEVNQAWENAQLARGWK